MSLGCTLRFRSPNQAQCLSIPAASRFRCRICSYFSRTRSVCLYHASRHDETSEAVTLAVHLLPTLSPPFTGLATIDRNEDGAPSPKGRMEPEKSQKQRVCTVAVEEGETPHR